MREDQLGRCEIPVWQDEYRASYEAAKNCPNLSDMDRYHLIQDAIDRATEAHQVIETDDFMKGVLYGYGEGEVDEEYGR